MIYVYCRGEKKDKPYRDVKVTFENHYDTAGSDDDVNKPTFTIQPHSQNPLTSEDINTEKQKNKYTWTVLDKYHKSTTMGNKNIAEWIDDEVKPLDGKRAKSGQNWSNEGQDSESVTGADSEDSDTELLQN